MRITDNKVQGSFHHEFHLIETIVKVKIKRITTKCLALTLILV